MSAAEVVATPAPEAAAAPALAAAAAAPEEALPKRDKRRRNKGEGAGAGDDAKGEQAAAASIFPGGSVDPALTKTLMGVLNEMKSESPPAGGSVDEAKQRNAPKVVPASASAASAAASSAATTGTAKPGVTTTSNNNDGSGSSVSSKENKDGNATHDGEGEGGEGLEEGRNRRRRQRTRDKQREGTTTPTPTPAPAAAGPPTRRDEGAGMMQMQQPQQQREPEGGKEGGKPKAAGKGKKERKDKPQQPPQAQAQQQAQGQAAKPPKQQQQQQQQKPARQQPQQQMMAQPQQSMGPRPSSSMPAAAPAAATHAHANEAAPPALSVAQVQMHLAALNLSGTNAVVERLPVPRALWEWTATHVGELNAILAQVRAQSNVMSIVLDRGDAHASGSPSEGERALMITALGGDEARKARALLEIHLKNQEFLARTERRLQQVHEEITAVQGAVAAGLRIELRIDPSLTGTVIGKNGERIKRVYEATGVTRIDVTEEGIIRIAGPTQGSVLKAREMLELVQEDVPVSPAVFPWLSRPMLNDMREGSGCAALRAPPEAPNTVRIVGTRKQVDSAKLLLETQLGYIERHQAMRASEHDLRQKLHTMEDRTYAPPSSSSSNPNSNNHNHNGPRNNRRDDRRQQQQQQQSQQPSRGPANQHQQQQRQRPPQQAQQMPPQQQPREPSPKQQEEEEEHFPTSGRRRRPVGDRDRDEAGRPPRKGLTLREAAGMREGGAFITSTINNNSSSNYSSSSSSSVSNSSKPGGKRPQGQGGK